jgi:hypothetical protein
LQTQVSAEPAVTLQSTLGLVSITSNSGCCGYCCRNNQLPAAILQNLAAAHCGEQLQAILLCLHAGTCTVAGGALLLSIPLLWLLLLLLLLLLLQALPLGCWLCSAVALALPICCCCFWLLHEPGALCYCCRQCQLHQRKLLVWHSCHEAVNQPADSSPKTLLLLTLLVLRCWCCMATGCRFRMLCAAGCMLLLQRPELLACTRC